MAQKPSLDPQQPAASITRKAAETTGSDDPMTGYDQRTGVRATSRSHGSGAAAELDG